jgi:hypothetical protein
MTFGCRQHLNDAFCRHFIDAPRFLCGGAFRCVVFEPICRVVCSQSMRLSPLAAWRRLSSVASVLTAISSFAPCRLLLLPADKMAADKVTVDAKVLKDLTTATEESERRVALLTDRLNRFEALRVRSLLTLPPSLLFLLRMSSPIVRVVWWWWWWWTGSLFVCGSCQRRLPIACAEGHGGARRHARS